MIVNKEKQKEDWVQDKEVFLYKPHDILSKFSRPKTLEPMFIQDKINNLEKYMKFLQLPVKTVPFHLPPYYKSLWQKEEQNKQYWNEIAVEFLKQKHNVNITRWGFPIEMYMGGPSYKTLFHCINFTRENNY